MERIVETKVPKARTQMSSDTTPIRLLNAVQTGEALNISSRQVYDEVREGRLPAVRIGTRVLFRPEDILDFIEARVRRGRN